MSALGRAALAVARAELARGVRGGLPGWGRFRSPDIDAYMALVGLKPHEDREQEGWPWCAAAVHAMFEAACRDDQTAYPLTGIVPKQAPPNPCPRTAGALHLWELAPLKSRTQLPAPGDVFVLDHGKGRGHVGFVATVSPDGKTIGSVEPDSNPAGSRIGDQWAEHPLWQPSDGARGRLVGYIELG